MSTLFGALGLTDTLPSSIIYPRIRKLRQALLDLASQVTEWDVAVSADALNALLASSGYDSVRSLKLAPPRSIQSSRSRILPSLPFSTNALPCLPSRSLRNALFRRRRPLRSTQTSYFDLSRFDKAYVPSLSTLTNSDSKWTSIFSSSLPPSHSSNIFASLLIPSAKATLRRIELFAYQHSLTSKSPAPSPSKR